MEVSNDWIFVFGWTVSPTLYSLQVNTFTCLLTPVSALFMKVSHADTVPDYPVWNIRPWMQHLRPDYVRWTAIAHSLTGLSPPALHCSVTSHEVIPAAVEDAPSAGEGCKQTGKLSSAERKQTSLVMANTMMLHWVKADLGLKRYFPSLIGFCLLHPKFPGTELWPLTEARWGPANKDELTLRRWWSSSTIKLLMRDGTELCDTSVATSGEAECFLTHSSLVLNKIIILDQLRRENLQVFWLQVHPQSKCISEVQCEVLHLMQSFFITLSQCEWIK